MQFDARMATRKVTRMAGAVLAVLSCFVSLSPLSKGSAEESLSFAVASIKPANKAGNSGMRIDANGLTWPNVIPQKLIETAFGVQPY